MRIVSRIQEAVSNEIKNLYQVDLQPADIQVSETKPDFEGDYTVVLFALTKPLKKAPDKIGNELGEKLITTNPQLFVSFNVIKGFLNLSISDRYWTDFLYSNHTSESFGFRKRSEKRIMVEYSSPNTNKPLHLGHLRNNFLGWSIAEIFSANGYDTIKTCVVNDRGIHICKSMLAWQRLAYGATPENTGTKGDHFVGDYYVLFETALKAETEPIFKALLNGQPVNVYMDAAT